MPPALRTRALRKNYHAGVLGCSASVEVLRGVDLDVSRGEVVGVAGAAGSGKTTLLLCLAGLLRPDAGSVCWFGERVAPHRPAGIAYVQDRPTQYAFLSVREALGFYATLNDLPLADRESRVEEALALTALRPMAQRRVGQLHADALRWLAIAQALIARPRLLLLDESVCRIHHNAEAEPRGFLRALASRGTAVVVASSDADALGRLCDRFVALVGGVITQVYRPVATERARSVAEGVR